MTGTNTTKTIPFKDERHREFVRDCIAKAGIDDCYHRALFYALGCCSGTRGNIEQLYDFDTARKFGIHQIRPEGLNKGWQTGQSIRLTRFAFALFTDHAMDDDDPALYTPSELFCTEFMTYQLAAVRLRFPWFDHE